MQSDFTQIELVARRSYELGRVASGLRRGLAIALAVAVLSHVVIGRVAWLWLPSTVVAIAFSEWRGRVWMRGARRGVLAGFATVLLPLSVLRPCCSVESMAMGNACCTTPWVCWAAGAAVGLVMALFVPKAPEGQRAEAAIGMIVGIASVSVVRCSTLFVGESVGLLGGVVAGVLAATAVRASLRAE